MIKKIKWGVIGSGGIALRRTIPEGITRADNAELISVYDVNNSVNIKVAEEFNARPSGSIKELLDDDIDAVYIGSPPYFHLDQVKACAGSRKHILCEKPLGLSTKEAEEMIRICEKENVILGVGLMMRFVAQHRAALELIREGRLGKPVYARAQLSCWYPPIEGAWRQDPEKGGGGSLMDMGSHCIDLLEMFFGSIERVHCFINNTVHSYRSEDSAVVTLYFRNGAIGTVDTYFCIPDNSSKNILELYGSRGSILARGTIGQGDAGEMTAYLEGSDAGYDATQARESSDGIKLYPDPVNTYKSEIEDFSRAVIENKSPSLNASLGLRNIKILSACYKSANSGKVVEIE